MGKDKSRHNLRKGSKHKKSFLDNQKKHRHEVKLKKKSSSLKDKDDYHKRAFTFETFSDQVASVDSSIVYQLAGIGGKVRVSSDSDTNSSVFVQTLAHWKDLNLTLKFQQTEKKLIQYASLHQVVFSQKEIVDVLCEHLSQGTVLDIQPVLELTAALATDLQQEFYPFLSQVINTLMSHPLKVREANMIKWGLRCLGHMLKILWKPISQNLHEVYDQLSGLFDKNKPDFIRYLGAETVAFLLRKCKQKEIFLEHILLIKDDSDPKAIAKLLFETIKTVNEQFNTHLQTLWPVILNHLSENHIQSRLLETVCQFCAEHSSKDYIQPILDQLFDKIDSFIKDDKSESADYLIECLIVCVRQKGGKLLKNIDKFSALFVNPKAATEKLLNLIVIFLKSDKLNLTKELVDTITSTVLKSEHFSLDMKLKFVTSFSEHQVLHSSLLKPYLVLVQNSINTKQDQVVQHLASMVQSSCPPCNLGSELLSWKPFLVDLQLVKELRSLSSTDIFTSIIIKNIVITNSSTVVSDCITCVGAIKPIDKKSVIPALSQLIKEIVSSPGEKRELLPLAISTLVFLSKSEHIKDLINLDDILKMFLESKSADPRSLLQSVNFLLTVMMKDNPVSLLGPERTAELLSVLVNQLSSPDGLTRELGLHTMLIILSGLGPEVDSVLEEGQLSLRGIIETLLSAEQCPSSLTNYKDKLNKLERVDQARVSKVMEKFPSLTLLVLHYLLGLLYTNFTLLWTPIMDLVANIANCVKRDVFWEVFGDMLKIANKDVQNMIKCIKEGTSEKDDLRIDYINYRNHLWSVMSKFPKIAESKNREIVPMFLDNFMQSEYVAIRQLSENKDNVESHKTVIQSTVRSLLMHLELFVKFEDLKSLHRGEELKEFIVGLLSHKLATVQKNALEILVAYKLKFLLPYKDNLLKLLDEKDFKAELINFPLYGEDTEIKDEHRTDILPIIMKILYGRLRATKTTKKGNKGGVVARRGLILHHLMQLPENEMMIFFHLLFQDLFTDCDLEKDRDVFQYIIEHGLAPKKSSAQMQACVEIFQSILSKLGKLLDTSLPYLLSVIVWLGFVTQHMIETENSSTFKSLRNNIYSQLANFYIKYTNYKFSDMQKKGIFEVFLWKSLSSFKTDFIHSSSGLLQVLLSWSKSSTHRKLFLMIHPDTGSRILENVCSVLNKSTTNVKVSDTILDIIQNLVTIEEEDDNMDSEENIGVCVVKMEVRTLLNHFQTWIKTTNENKKSMRKVSVKLDILASLAPFVTEPDVALELFQQLITLSNSLKKSDTVLKVLTISKSLMIHIEKDKAQEVVSSLLPMFGKLSTRPQRIELSLVLNNASSVDSRLALVAEISVELNSFDARRVEEPDFERRMGMFSRIRDFVKEDRLLSELEINAIILNCCFYLKNETDNSLKTNALDALINGALLIKKLAISKPDISRNLVEKTCLIQIRAGIKNKDDTVRCDFVSFLKALVNNCSEVNTRLKDLARLSDDDSDNDFYENMRHVQLHRRGRAMTRLAKALDEDPGHVKQKNLTQIILPLATAYLLNDTYAKNSQLVDQAIELLGSVTKTLPWAQYEHSIKYYIELFTKDTVHQKQLVKITTIILDAFHFELNEEKFKGEPAEDDNYVEPKEDKEKGSDVKAANEPKSLSSKIFYTVNDVLLPKLQATLSGKVKGPTAISDEDKLILRVPLAIPIVKMLKIMSFKSLYRAVPGIINKISSFLKSKAIEIREAARLTLVQVMALLGARFVSFVVKELQAQLTKGYQLHILSFTLHLMLHKMSEQGLLQTGDLDSACGQIVHICLGEMFGIVSEEKEVRQITGKLVEARGTKAYDTLQVLARYISNNKLMALAKPFADKCGQLSTFKNLVKIRESFRHIVLGLLDNTALDSLHCLIFIYGVTTDQIKIGAISLVQRNGMKKEESQSIFIVQRAPKREGVYAKTSKSASQHIIHEFGLNLLNFLLKRSSLLSSNETHCSRLEPFVQILLDFLSSSHVTLVTASLRSLLWIVKFPLSILDKDKILEITNKVFDLLNKFGGGTDGKGENHDLVIIASKLLVVLIRDVELTQLNETHLKTVLDYVVTDVMDPLKATTVFGLLSAIIGRKLASPELHDVMLKMMEMSIQSGSEQTRIAARSVLLSYVSNYNLKKKLGKVLDFFAKQLGYDLECGRISAADTLRSLITTLGTQKVDPHAMFLFFSLAPHLVNDDSSLCRKHITSTLGTLLKTVTSGSVVKFLNPVMTWYEEAENPAHSQLACHLLGIFVDNLSAKVVKPHMDKLFNLLPGKIEGTDHLAVQALHLTTKLVRKVEDEKAIVDPTELSMVAVWKSVHLSLLHSHTWVRLLSAQLIGLYLAQVGVDEVMVNITERKEGWLADTETLKSLILDSLEQMSLVLEPESDSGTQVIKNLVALTKVTLEPSWQDFVLKNCDKLTFHWVLKKAVKIANQELVNSPKLTVKRMLVFNLIAACCLDSTEDNIVSILDVVLPPLHREISSNHPNPELKTHSQDVVDLIKTRVDENTFSKVYMEVQLNLSKKKIERAAQKKQNLVLNPKIAAKRKIQQNEAKKKAKKAKYKK